MEPEFTAEFEEELELDEAQYYLFTELVKVQQRLKALEDKVNGKG